MSNQRVTYSEIGVTKCPKKQQIKHKNKNSAELEINYAEINLHKVPESLQRNNKNSCCKEFYCGHCPKDWFLYSNNCYYIDIERKTWNESQTACALKKSHLLYIENKEEMADMGTHVEGWALPLHKNQQ
ncbi:natural killer cells antigen CD94-like [Rhynchocyon petersi]